MMLEPVPVPIVREGSVETKVREESRYCDPPVPAVERVRSRGRPASSRCGHKAYYAPSRSLGLTGRRAARQYWVYSSCSGAGARSPAPRPRASRLSLRVSVNLAKGTKSARCAAGAFAATPASSQWRMDEAMRRPVQERRSRPADENRAGRGSLIGSRTGSGISSGIWRAIRARAHTTAGKVGGQSGAGGAGGAGGCATGSSAAGFARFG